MDYKWIPLLLIACAASIFVSGCGGGSLGAAPVTTDQTLAVTSAPTATKTIRLSLMNNMRFVPAASQQRYGLYECGEHEVADAKAFKENSPGAKVFLYQMAGAAYEAEWARTCPNDPIGYFWIQENRPEWFLSDSEGQRIHYTDYPSIWALDPGNEEYQRMWAENAVRRAKSIGADGVKIDAVNSRYDWNHTTVPTKYPAQSDYYKAMDSFVRNVTPVIRASGLLVIGNGSGEMWNYPPWSDWIGYFDGREYENPPTYESEQDWRDLLAGYASLPDKIYVHYLPDPQKYPDVFRFKVASFLLWMGSNSYAGCPYNAGPPIYDPLLGICIGQPTSACAKIGNTTYRRTFEYGEVIVNISASSSEAVQVGPKLRDVTNGPVAAGTVTLAPHQSLILATQRANAR